MKVITRIVRALWFPLWFLGELMLANAVVAWDVVTPRHRMRPGVIRTPVRSRTDFEVTLLANLISLTPGTLTLETGDGVLYVHAMFVRSPDNVRRRVRLLEDHLLRILR